MTFSSTDLMEFYRTFEPEVKKATVNWRIYNLMQEGILNRVGRGKFSLGKGVAYIPDVSNKLNSVYKKIKSDFPFLSVCLWSTSVLNEFMLHQPGRYYQLIEVDKDAMESVFYYLKDNADMEKVEKDQAESVGESVPPMADDLNASFDDTEQDSVMKDSISPQFKTQKRQ